jgi:peptide/nickel transport system permease protein
MTFGRYLRRRVLAALLLIYLVSSAAFLLTIAAPGDFAIQSAPDIDLGFGDVATRRAALGLDRPVIVQYLDWMGRAARFDFGQSMLYNRPVIGLLRERALYTALLATAALVAATAVGIPLGLYTGIRRDGFAVRMVRAVSLLLVSTPSLLASLALVVLAARTGWLPVGGVTSTGSTELSAAERLLDLLWHLALPTIALALPLAAVLERLQSRAISRASDEAFVRAARARGLSSEAAQLKHGWPGSIGPVLGLYGVLIGTLFSGSFVVETITTWPGLGRLLYDALRARDLYLVAGSAAAGAVFLALGTLLADLLHAAADPRVYLESHA